MKCNEAVGFLSPYIDSELDPRTTFDITQHLEQCQTCAERFDQELKLEDAMLKTLFPKRPKEVELALTKKIEAAVRAADAARIAAESSFGGAREATQAAPESAPSTVPPVAVPPAAQSSPARPARGGARWKVLALLLAVGVGAALGAYLPRGDRGTPVEPPTQVRPSEPKAVTRERHPLRAPGVEDEAFSCYERALGQLKLDRAEDRTLAAWSKKPAAPPPETLRPAVKRNLSALGILKRGTDARAVTPRVLSENLGKRILTLGRLTLAAGGLELESGAREAACERAADVARFGEDLVGAGPSDLEVSGAVLESEAGAALEAWGPKQALPPHDARRLADVLGQLACLGPNADNDYIDRITNRARAQLARAVEASVSQAQVQPVKGGAK